MNFVDAIGIFAYLALSAIGLVIAYAWIVLPFKVVNRLDKIVEATERTALAAERAAPLRPFPAPVVKQAPLHEDPDLAEHLARKAQRG